MNKLMIAFGISLIGLSQSSFAEVALHRVRDYDSHSFHLQDLSFPINYGNRNLLTVFDNDKSLLWSHAGKGDVIFNLGVDEQVLVFADLLDTPAPPRYQIIGLEARDTVTGRSLWHKEILGDYWFHFDNHLNDGKLARIGQRKIVVFLVGDVFKVVDALTGDFLLEIQIPKSVSSESVSTGQNGSSLMVGSSGYSYLALAGGKTFVYRNGQEIWSQDVRYRDSDDENGHYFRYASVQGVFEPNDASVAIVYSSVNHLNPNHQTLIYNKADGALIQSLPQATSVSVDEKAFYLMHTDGIIAYDNHSFKPIWKTELSASPNRDKALLVDDKFVYALKEWTIDKGKDRNVLVVMGKNDGKVLTQEWLCDDCYVHIRFAKDPYKFFVRGGTYRGDPEGGGIIPFETLYQVVEVGEKSRK